MSKRGFVLPIMLERGDEYCDGCPHIKYFSNRISMTEFETHATCDAIRYSDNKLTKDGRKTNRPNWCPLVEIGDN